MKLLAIISLGFAAGGLMGGAILAVDHFAGAQPHGKSDNGPASVQAPITTGKEQPTPQATTKSAPSAKSGLGFYEAMAGAWAEANGGRISLVELNALAQIAQAVRGREDQFLSMAGAVDQQQGGISLREMLAIAHFINGQPGVTNERGYSDMRSGSPAGNSRGAIGLPQVGSPYRRSNTSSYSDRLGLWNDDHRDRSRVVQERDWMPSSSSSGAINARTGEYLNPTGDGYTSGSTYYAPSGPDGVVNPRTGEYSPTIPQN